MINTGVKFNIIDIKLEVNIVKTKHKTFFKIFNKN